MSIPFRREVVSGEGHRSFVDDLSMVSQRCGGKKRAHSVLEESRVEIEFFKSAVRGLPRIVPLWARTGI